MEGKGKPGRLLSPPFPAHPWAEGTGCWWSVHEIKSKESVLYNDLTVLIRTKHIHVWTTKYRACNFGEFVHKLNAYLLAYKINIV